MDVFVGFMWVRTPRSWFLSNLSPLYKVMSRNVSSVSLSSYYANLIVWCSWLMVFMYVVNSDADTVQMTKN